MLCTTVACNFDEKIILFIPIKMYLQLDNQQNIFLYNTGTIRERFQNF